jgi:bifunctional non-homologous end joining protein LigD
MGPSTLAFDLLAVDGEDFRRNPFSERKAALRKILKCTWRGIQYVEHTEGDSREMFKQSASFGFFSFGLVDLGQIDFR